VIGKPLPYILAAWVALGAVRVLLGASTSPVAYVSFGAFWLASAILVIAAIRQLVISKLREFRVEAVCVVAGISALFSQGLFGNGETLVVALIVFLVSALVLTYVYARRLRQRRLSASR
jgi:chromate transport protein ChrA